MSVKVKITIGEVFKCNALSEVEMKALKIKSNVKQLKYNLN